MKKFLMLFLFIVFIPNSHADIFLEPHLSLGIIGDATESGGGNKEYDTSDVNLGLKAGYSVMMFNFGIDYTIGQQTWEIEAPSNAAGLGLKEEFDSRTWGLFGGVEFPILLRAWVTYYFDAKLEDTNENPTFDKDDELSGSGFGLGLGYTLLPLLSINIEYRSFTYDTFKDNSSGEKLNLPTGSTGEFEHSQIYVGISLPITI
ncbi:MAG: outer membrane beta-barrel protein [Bdellovibrionales bacterium]|nr:outer membrane beta-barrel protein [Bdellovibrionales bacterium]